MTRGRKRQLVKVPEVKANLNYNIHNRFDIEVIDAATGEIKQRAQAENVICNALWTRLLAPNTYFNYIHYGTGSGTPAVTDTSLFTFLGYGTPVMWDDAIDNQAASGYASYRRKIQLSELTANGSTLTEVGIGYGTSAATLCTHAMLKDMNGNAISITKTSTDIINVYATVFVHWNAAGYDNGSIKIIPYLEKGTSVSYTLRGFFGYLLGCYSNTTYDKALPPTGATPTNGAYNFSASVKVSITPTYSIASKTITLTMTRLSAGNYNIGGILSIWLLDYTYAMPSIILLTGGSWFEHSTIVGEAIGTGDGITKDFATAFPFPENAIVYLDGVAQSSGVSVVAEPLKYNDMGQYFISIKADSTTANLIPQTSPAMTSSYLWNTFSTADASAFYFYNPYYSFGIASFYRSNCAVSVSNDLINWQQIAANGTGSVSVDSTYRSYKYWKVIPSTTSGQVNALTLPSPLNGKPIHFDTAPASGAVITADYTTKTIAKDANHVFDLTVTIQLGEHVT